jgi:hypothetical protein
MISWKCQTIERLLQARLRQPTAATLGHDSESIKQFASKQEADDKFLLGLMSQN